MKAKLHNQLGEEVGAVDLPKNIFDLDFNPDLVHQALVAQLGNARQNLAHTKDRGEVRGGGKKPWRQKGTGRARHGSTRSPIWKGGGVTFGPTNERNFAKKINKRMKQKAIFMSLSSKIREGMYLILDKMEFENNKTKEAKKMFDALAGKLKDYKTAKSKKDSILIILADNGAKRAINNLPFASILNAKSLNVKDILAHKYLMILKDSIPVIEKTYIKA